MSSTRDFKSPGIFAEDATTVISPTPIAGVAYRDAVNGTADTPNGWRYGTRVASQDWNQIMFLLTSMLSTIDTQGLLGWSDQVDYAVPSITFGSDGLPYFALQASGPITAPQDPIASPLYWERFASHGMVVLSTAGTSTWTVPASMQLGYIRPKVRVIGGGGGGGRDDATAGGGGGAGGEAYAVLNLTGVASVSVTVGAGGLGRTGSSGAGLAGGTTSFGAYLQATGGGGGDRPSGGSGGNGSLGTVNSSGIGGGAASPTPTGSGTSRGSGGNGDGSQTAPSATAGSTAQTFGCGGTGSILAANGGNGRSGAVIIEW